MEIHKSMALSFFKGLETKQSSEEKAQKPVEDKLTKEAQSGDKEDDEKGLMSRLGEMKKSIILPLALSAGIISGCADPELEKIEKARAKKETEKEAVLKSGLEELAKKGINTKIEGSDRDSQADFKQIIVDWANDNANKEILKSIVEIKLDSTEHSYEIIKEGEKSDIVKETATAILFVLTKDKKPLVIKGAYAGENVFSDNAFYFSNRGKELKSREKAVKDALEQIKKELN